MTLAFQLPTEISQNTAKGLCGLQKVLWADFNVKDKIIPNLPAVWSIHNRSIKEVVKWFKRRLLILRRNTILSAF